MDKVMNREMIDKKYKWKLEDIYENWEKWDEDISKLKEDINSISKFQALIVNLIQTHMFFCIR